MGRLIRFLFYIVILGFVGLVGFAYVAPFFGVDFAPTPTEIREPISLDVSN